MAFGQGLLWLLEKIRGNVWLRAFSEELCKIFVKSYCGFWPQVVVVFRQGLWRCLVKSCGRLWSRIVVTICHDIW